ncbi:MAG: LamG-like jellyroll fold domain-containing protein, partial [Acidobacteriota bacterium]
MFASPLEIDDTASGYLAERVYDSARFGAVSLLVYTPPGYYQAPGAVYPTIYWLHGSGDNHLQLLDALNELPGTGTAVERLDALIASEQLPPLMIVSVGSPLVNAKWEDSLLDLVTDELPDFIDANFSSDPRRAGRGLEGFSQGSEGVSRYVTFRPDRFGTASLLGGGFLKALWTENQTTILRDKLEVYMATGDLDSFLTNAQDLDAELTILGIPHTFVTLSGVPHNVAQIYAQGGLANLQWHAARWADAGLVDAGPDQDLDTAMPINVDLAGAIDDPDGDLGAFTLLWEQVSGPGVASFDDDTSLTPTVTLPTAGTYHFELTATGTTTACDVVRVTAIDSADALALHLPFDDGTGTDVSGQGRDGTVAGSPASEPAGQRNGALSFDGVDDSVTVSDFAYGPDFSLSLWVKPTDLIGTAYQYFVSHGLFDVVSSLNFYFVEDGATLRHGPAAEEHEAARSPSVADVGSSAIDSYDAAVAREAGKDGIDPPGAPRGASPRLRFGIRDGAGDPSLAQTQVPALEFVDGEWHHLAVVVGPKPTYGHQIWIDGVAVAQCIDDGDPMTDECETGGDAIDPATDLVIGGRSDFDPSRYYLGGLDEVRFYDRALLPEEIELLAEESTNAQATVEVGGDRTVYAPAGAILTGSVVDDGPLSELDIGWQVAIESGGTATFVDPGSPNTGVTFSAPGFYVLQLCATDPITNVTVCDGLEILALGERLPTLVGYWPMDQDQSTDVPDDSGLQHDGTATAPGWLTGLSGHAISLNGSDAVAVDTSPLLDLDPVVDDLSLTAWIRVAAGEVGTIVAKGASGSAQYRLYLDDPGVDGRSDLYGEIGGAVNATADGIGDRIDDGEWHHVALVYDADSGTQQLFVDSVAVGSAVAAGTMTSADAVQLGSGLAGDLDEVRIYSRALDTAGLQSSRAPLDCVAPGCLALHADGWESG